MQHMMEAQCSILCVRHLHLYPMKKRVIGTLSASGTPLSSKITESV